MEKYHKKTPLDKPISYPPQEHTKNRKKNPEICRKQQTNKKKVEFPKKSFSETRNYQIMQIIFGALAEKKFLLLFPFPECVCHGIMFNVDTKYIFA